MKSLTLKVSTNVNFKWNIFYTSCLIHVAIFFYHFFREKCLWIWLSQSCIECCDENFNQGKLGRRGVYVYHMQFCAITMQLTHWGRVMQISVSKLTIISSDNDLSPGWHQAIIWTNAGILLIGPLEIKFSEILIEIIWFSFKKIHLNISAKWQPFCLCLSVLIFFKILTILMFCCFIHLYDVILIAMNLR